MSTDRTTMFSLPCRKTHSDLPQLTPLRLCCTLAVLFWCCRPCPILAASEQSPAIAGQGSSGLADSNPPAADRSAAEPNTTPVNGSDSANLAERITALSQTNPALSRDNSTAEPNKTQLTASALTRRLWATRAILPQTEQNPSNPDDIRRLIEQIRSMRFETQYGPSAARPAAALRVIQPNQQGAIPQQQTQLRPAIEPAGLFSPASYQRLTDDIMQTIQSLSQHPEQARNPLEMAELLFACDKRKEAAVFYKHVLGVIDPNTSQGAEDRAWVLFQIGNCLRSDDQAAARDYYMKLIAEYPKCPWIEIAKTWGRLISWYQKTDPKKLISQSGL